MIVKCNTLNFSTAVECDECTKDSLCDEHSSKVLENMDLSNMGDNTLEPDGKGIVIDDDENDDGIVLLGMDNENLNE